MVMETVLLILTGIISTIDLLVNSFALYTAEGACNFNFCCCNFKHESDEVVESHEKTLRMSRNNDTR